MMVQLMALANLIATLPATSNLHPSAVKPVTPTPSSTNVPSLPPVSIPQAAATTALVDPATELMALILPIPGSSG
jgi:hypothetical protein